MKIAVLGAGFSGLTAAYKLNQKGHEVWVFEKESVPGGAAGGFKQPPWDWYLDNSYHHWFTNDTDVLGLAHQIGFNDIIVKRPITASLIKKEANKQETINNKLNSGHPRSNRGSMDSRLRGNDISNLFTVYRLPFTSLFGSSNDLIKLDSPLDLLCFNRLSLFNRLRMGAVLAALKFGPKLALYDTVSTDELLTKTMGKTGYEAIWQILMQKKYEDYYRRINASFIWTRVKKRSASLAYPAGGHQAFCNHFAELLIKSGVKIKYDCEVKEINSKQETINKEQKNCHPRSNRGSMDSRLRGNNISNLFTVYCLLFNRPVSENFDLIVNTLPSPLFLQLEKNILPQNYREQLSKIDYLGAQNVIIETDEPILPNNTYWLNILDLQNPWTVAVQHTNYMDKSHFGNKHLLYLGRYTNKPINPKFEYRNSKQYSAFVKTTVDKPNSNDQNNSCLDNSNLFRTSDFGFRVLKNSFLKFAQPLYTTTYTKIMPDYITPVPGLYFANLELAYPHDRGTNYAVRVGKEVVKRIRK